GGGRETGKERGAHRLGADIGADPLQIVGVERRLAQLATSALVAADRAAVVLGDRSHPPGDPGLVVDDPQDLVDDERAAACRAARPEHLAERRLEAGFAARGGSQALERGVEMADVGWPEDDLGEHPIERARLERYRSALAGDGRPRDPATAPEQVRHDLTSARVRVDPRADKAGRRRWRESVEDGEGGTRLGVMGST